MKELWTFICEEKFSMFCIGNVKNIEKLSTEM